MNRALAALAFTLLAAGTAGADQRDGRFGPPGSPAPALAGAPYGGPAPIADPRFDDGRRGYEDRRGYDDRRGHVDRRVIIVENDFRYGYDGRAYNHRRDHWERKRWIQRGDQLTPWQFRRAEFIRDFWNWRLPPPPRGAAWMRLGHRLVLVRQRDGLVIDVLRA